MPLGLFNRDKEPKTYTRKATRHTDKIIYMDGEEEIIEWDDSLGKKDGIRVYKRISGTYYDAFLRGPGFYYEDIVTISMHNVRKMEPIDREKRTYEVEK